MRAEILLSRLEKVKKLGEGRWIACCPAHNDRKPSLSVRETAEGIILAKCWSGCTFHEVITAVGIDASEMFPPRQSTGSPIKGPFFSFDALRGLAVGLSEAALILGDVVTGEPVASDYRGRLIAIAAQVSEAMSAIQPHIRKGRPYV